MYWGFVLVNVYFVGGGIDVCSDLCGSVGVDYLVIYCLLSLFGIIIGL